MHELEASRNGKARWKKEVRRVLIFKKMFDTPAESVISVITEIREMNDLPPAAQKFILHWGEMGARWGINRTVAQVHALLYLSDRPLNAEEICQTLVLARSNVSVALRELQGWGIVKVTHLAGDRRDHFESMTDVFEMFRLIMNERKRREIDPTIKLIDDCLEASSGKAEGALVRARLEKMREFFDLALTFSAQLDRVSTPVLVKAVRMGDKAIKILGLTGDKAAKSGERGRGKPAA